LDRAANSVAVNDRYALRAAGGKIEMSLMTPCTVRQDGANAVVLSGGLLTGARGVRIAIGGTGAPAIRTEEIAITDSRLRSSWGNRLYRTVLTWTGAPANGELKMEITQA
jgi:hypothetical protein